MAHSTARGRRAKRQKTHRSQRRRQFERRGFALARAAAKGEPEPDRRHRLLN